MRENQPVFLVVGALFDKPGRDPQGQQRGDEPDQPYEKSVGVLHRPNCRW